MSQVNEKETQLESVDLYIASEIYKDELDGDSKSLLTIWISTTLDVDSHPSCPNTPVVPSTDRGDNSCRDRHWDTPISVNVRANVDIVVGVVRCDNPAFQVLMLEEIDEHLTAISEYD
ncbi:hypothetical protein Tco_1183563 [Tanacetum coccineum]